MVGWDDDPDDDDKTPLRCEACDGHWEKARDDSCYVAARCAWCTRGAMRPQELLAWRERQLKIAQTRFRKNSNPLASEVPVTLSPVRQKAVDFALSLVGMTALDVPPGMRQRYLDLIASGEDPRKQSAMAKMSGCALVVAAIWRHLGVAHPSLNPPYKIGTAVSRLVQIASEKKAWKRAERSGLPLPGDMVLIGNNTPDGGVEHVFTVTSVSIGGRTLLESVDGGQRDALGLQCVRAKKRVWHGGRDFGLASNDPGAQLVSGRKIIGWADVEALVRV